MLTYRKARELLHPRDIVYIPMAGKIIEAVVEKITQDTVVTNVDELWFDEVGSVWFMTKKCAEGKL